VSTRGRQLALTLLLGGLPLGACGPYAKLAQKLDVSARIAGDTWIAAAGADRQEIRLLLVGDLDVHGAAPFAFTSVTATLHSDGTGGEDVSTVQGYWYEAAGGATTLAVLHTYHLPDEYSTSLFSRVGTHRDDGERTLGVQVTRSAHRLVVTGDASLAGTYLLLPEALAGLGATARSGATAPRDASCAFQLLNLTVSTSDARIIGFGGTGMLQYLHSENYIGMVDGQVRVSVSGGLGGSTTRITYGSFIDEGGVMIDGPQVTSVNSSGNGSMSGVLTFWLSPSAADPTTVTTVTGTVDYGSGDAVQIRNGAAVSGSYATQLDGGAAANVPVAGLPSPSIAECLNLP
jgi:hypothetical protein